MHKITRAEALKLSEKIIINAEKERIKIADEEANCCIQFDNDASYENFSDG